MKNKILISVYVISIDKRYDIFVPINSKVGEIADLICNTIKNMNDINFDYSLGIALLDCNDNVFYDLNAAINETNLRNGKKIILFNY